MPTRTIDTAPYTAPEGYRRKTWIARLCRFVGGSRDGQHYVDFYVPAKDGKRRRVRAGIPDNDPATFRRVVEEEIPGEIADALDGIHAAEPIQVGENPAIAEIFEWYTDEIQVARGYTEGTRAETRRIFQTVAAFLHTHDVDLVADLVRTPRVLDTWIAHRLKTHKPGTVRKEWTKIRAALRAAAERGLAPTLPWYVWTPPSRPEKILSGGLDATHYHALLSRLQGNTRRRGGQSSVYNVVRFLAFTGCRPIDACNLRRQDVDIEERLAVFIQQKTRKPVAVALNTEAIAAIQDELARCVETDRVFTDRLRKPLRPDVIGSALRWHSIKLGIDPPITPKLFRQAVVSELIDAGADQEHIKAITGHRSDAIEAYKRLRKGAAHRLAQHFADRMNSSETPENEPKETTEN